MTKVNRMGGAGKAQEHKNGFHDNPRTFMTSSTVPLDASSTVPSDFSQSIRRGASL